MYTVADPGFPGQQCLVKIHAKMKELGPIGVVPGTRPLDPLMANHMFSYVLPT